MEPHVKPSIRTGLSRNTRVKQLLKSIPTPARSKTFTPVPEMDMSPDQLSMDNAPGVANGVRRGMGLGNGLRNLAKRAEKRSPTPTLKSTSATTTAVSRQGSVGPGAEKMGGKDQKKGEDGKVGKGKLGKEAVPVAVQRRSGRKTAAAALKPVVEEKAKAKVVKKVTKGGMEGEPTKKAREMSCRKLERWEEDVIRDLDSDKESLDSEGSDLGFKVVSTKDKPAGISTITNTIPVKAKVAPAEDIATPAKDTAASGRSMRSSRPASIEDGKSAQSDEESNLVPVLVKRREQKASKGQGSSENRGTSEGSTDGGNGRRGVGGAGPVVVDDMDCEKEDELYKWRPVLSAQRKPMQPMQVYRSAKGRRKDMYRSLNRRSTLESKPPPKAKGKGTEEELVFLEPKFIEPGTYINLCTPAPQLKKQNEDADLLPKAEFKNPFAEYGTLEDSPDHLENPKFANGATSSVAQIDLTVSPFKKRKTKPSRYISDSDGSTLSTAASSPTPNVLDDGLDEPSTLSITSDPNICPICNDRFPDSFLLLYPVKVPSYNMRIQLDRCRRHKRHSAEEFCRDKKYPAMDIDWRRLSRRIDAHIPHLTEILEKKRSSTYRDAAGQDLATLGKINGKRKLMDTDWQSHTPGYYGPRGAHIMLTAIMKKMANRIREVGSNDRLIAGGGVSGFVQSVLVPELGVRLVMEDLKCSEVKARKVVKETVEMGELINDEDGGGGSGGDYSDDEEEGGKWVTL